MELCKSKKILKALADDTRLQIFEMLRNGTLCGCKILEQLQIKQPTLSHHMKIICDCGLVTVEKDWKWNYYSLNCEVLDRFLSFLGDTKCHKGSCPNKNNMCND